MPNIMRLYYTLRDSMIEELSCVGALRVVSPSSDYCNIVFLVIIPIIMEKLEKYRWMMVSRTETF